MYEQIIIRFNGEDAEDMKEAFFDFIRDHDIIENYILSCCYELDDHPKIEFEGDIIYVREVK